MKPAEFELLIERALESLPQAITEGLDNVAIVIQDWPSEEQLGLGESDNPHSLLGLYEGVPLVDRVDYGMVLPDKITLFQKSIEALGLSHEKIVEEIRVTVLHELAHHLGFTDQDLTRLGYD